ncbi:DNA-binding protein [Clavibacter nebraskensis]|uniref:DNA-binding protein n=1 Tax=Clavibacter nebraskensis TaxID=31963 RepID=A0A399QKH2_9MICO|nr:DNA-binding protein [Clavibacter nebraskensis]
MHLDEVRKRATLTVDETSAVMGTARASTYAAISRGEIPSLRIGRRLVVPVPALLALLGESAQHEA